MEMRWLAGLQKADDALNLLIPSPSRRRIGQSDDLCDFIILERSTFTSASRNGWNESISSSQFECSTLLLLSSLHPFDMIHLPPPLWIPPSPPFPSLPLSPPSIPSALPPPLALWNSRRRLTFAPID